MSSKSTIKKIFSDDQDVINSIVDKEIIELDTKVTTLDKKVDDSFSLLKEDVKNIELTIPEKGDKGDKGNDGLDGKDGYTPIKGRDYFDGEDGKDGKNGKDGKDGIGIKGEKGDKGDTGENPDVEDVIKLLKKKQYLEPKDIKGMPINMNDMRWHGGGLSKVSTDNTLTGDGTPSNPLSAQGVAENYKSKVSAADTTPNYLLNKLVAGTGITLTQENVGGNEDIKIASTANLQQVTDNGATTTNSITANSFIKTGGTSSQFLKADGSVDSSTYLTSLSGALLADGTVTGATSQAQAFTNGVKTGKIFPSADSTTAVGIFKADRTTNIFNVDTINGRVGIGTTLPTTQLYVKQTTYGNGITLETANGGGGYINIYQNAAASGQESGIRWSGVNENPVSVYAQVSGGYGSSYTNQYLRLSVADSSGILRERMKLDNLGNVGIGTSTPSEKLQVVGIISSGILSSVSGEFRMYQGTGPSYASLKDEASTTRIGLYRGNTSDFFTSYNTSTGDTEINATFANSNILFQYQRAEKMRITSTGNVGIGTTTPSAKLQILGITEQLRLNYNDLNYLSATIGSTGIATLNPIGTTPYLLLNKQIYGSFYVDDGTQATTLTNTGTYYQIAAGFTTGSVNGFTFQNARELVALVAGKYKVDWSMTVSSNTSDTTVEGAILIGSTAQMQTVNATRTKETGVEYSIGGTGIITLAVNDIVSLALESEASAGIIVTTTHGNLTLTRIDN